MVKQAERGREEWAGWEAGPRNKEGRRRRVGLRGWWAAGKERKRGENWARVGFGLGFPGQFGLSLTGLGLGSWAGSTLGVGLLSISLLLNLIQTKFEFKYEFEFKPQSNKSMHQHECNTKFKPMINFNYS